MIREIRISKGLSQIEAAKIVGLSIRTYQNYEYGNSTRDKFKINQIISILSSYNKYTLNTGIYNIEDIKNIINELLKDTDISFVYLFGSYAKGKATPSSDIDLLISDEIKGLEFIGLVDEFSKRFNKNIDLIRISDLKNNFVFLNEILKSGIKIYEGNKEWYILFKKSSLLYW